MGNGRIRRIWGALLACALCLAAGCAARAEEEDALPVMPTSDMAEKLASEVSPEVTEGFLPVCFRCDTDRKMVAFTVDDCNQPANLCAIIDLFREYGGACTIFPIGQNVSRIGDTLKSAWLDGFEIENHTWSHSGLYHEDDEAMCREIWDQSRAVSEALGVDYQMHFLRPRGGDNRYDQRTHAYIRQLGYYGIAYWSRVGLYAETSELAAGARSGDIFLFHTTDADVAQLRELVPWLHQAGYSFVTLNELFGLPDNETAPLSPAQDPPSLPAYERFPQTLRKNDYLRDVYLVQQRLSELGFLKGKYNGYYGDKTVSAVRAFQKSRGLTPDGVCGAKTWAALFPDP